ncbi:hypothetical protein [Rubrivirga sp. IMCC45206]|uniref:hypothetical protein n=1 Tax=Rubrivirga sp. IMCC45206 TaxID=3391614 RepID=UPI00398FE1A5
MTSPSPRLARTARLLAALLVPLVALPALAGLVVCATDAGVTTSWGERPCPKRAALPGVTADDRAAGACVVVPEATPAPLAAAPDLRAPAPVAIAAPVAAPRLDVASRSSRRVAPRGPPPATLCALGTVVLRV